MNDRPNTNPRLITILKALGGHEFTKSDWCGFAGCNSVDPWIAEVGDEIIIADGDSLSLINSDENSDAILLTPA